MSDLTDAEWERLCPLLPSSAGKRGQPWGDHRRIVNGILWRTWNGATWRAVPGERVFAELKKWRVLRKLRCDPYRATQIARAIATLNHQERQSR